MLLKNAKELKMLTMLALTKRCPPDGRLICLISLPLLAIPYPSLAPLSRTWWDPRTRLAQWPSSYSQCSHVQFMSDCWQVSHGESWWVMVSHGESWWVMVSLVLICSNHKAPCWPMHGPCCQVTLAKAASWLSAKSLSSFSRFDFHAAIELDEKRILC